MYKVINESPTNTKTSMALLNIIIFMAINLIKNPAIGGTPPKLKNWRPIKYAPSLFSLNKSFILKMNKLFNVAISTSKKKE